MRPIRQDVICGEEFASPAGDFALRFEEEGGTGFLCVRHAEGVIRIADPNRNDLARAMALIEFAGDILSPTRAQLCLSWGDAAREWEVWAIPLREESKAAFTAAPRNPGSPFPDWFRYRWEIDRKDLAQLLLNARESLVLAQAAARGNKDKH